MHCKPIVCSQLSIFCIWFVILRSLICELLSYFILVCASTCFQTIHCKSSTDMLFGFNSWICSDCCALRSFQELNRSEVILRALPHISGYFWIRIFFFPNWKSFPSTRSVFKSNSHVHTHPMVSGFTLGKLGLHVVPPVYCSVIGFLPDLIFSVIFSTLERGLKK